MKDEQILSMMSEVNSEESVLAEGTRPGMEQAQFMQMMDPRIDRILDLLEEKFNEKDHTALLNFLEYFADQTDGHLDILVTKHGASLVFLT